MLVSFILVMILGCAAQLRKPVQKSIDLKRPFEEVWDSTIKGLDRSGEIVTHTEKESGLIVVERDVAGSELPKITIDSGFWGWKRGKVKATIFLKPLSDSSTRVFISTKISGIGYLLEGYTLSSNGTLEETYLSLIRNLVYRREGFATLKTHYKKRQAYLGVMMQRVPEEVALTLGIPKGKGVFVRQVAQGSPAEKAGIKTGDVIIRFDGKEIKAEVDEDLNEFSKLVSNTQVGKEVEIAIIHKCKKKIITCIIKAYKEK